MNITEAVPENFAMPRDEDEMPAEHAAPTDPELNQEQAVEPEPAKSTTIVEQLTLMENSARFQAFDINLETPESLDLLP
ncbi:hypothetical protein V6N13_015114 [Hibiscus sabdariffa]